MAGYLLISRKGSRRMRMRKRVQLVFIIDFTGSMAACRGEVRANQCRLIEKLFSQILGIEVAVIAVGDDEERNRYMTRMLPLTSDQNQLVNFFNTVPNAGGGDADECYEKGLNQANELAWDKDATKVVVVIGDSIPHPVNHRKNPHRLDWRTEVRNLRKKDVIVHAVHCLAHYGGAQVRKFWAELAEIGGGVYLTLEQFKHVESLLLGIAHRALGEDSLQEFTTRLERDGSISTGLRNSFDTLLGISRKSTRSRSDGRIPVAASRFQVLRCTSDARQDVRDFAVDKGLISSPSEFNARVKGRLFYAHTVKTETLRPSHEVVIQEVATDTFFSGEDARLWLGIPTGTSDRLRPNPLGPEYVVWVQSKSVNRKLDPSQDVMVDMTESSGVLA